MADEKDEKDDGTREGSMRSEVFLFCLGEKLFAKKHFRLFENFLDYSCFSANFVIL